MQAQKYLSERSSDDQVELNIISQLCVLNERAQPGAKNLSLFTKWSKLLIERHLR